MCCIQATKEVNNMTVKMPYQCFINGKFEDAENGKTYETINPTDGKVSDVDACIQYTQRDLRRLVQDTCDPCVTITSPHR